MPEEWEVELHREINDAIYALPPHIVAAIRRTFWSFREDPFPPHSRWVGGFTDVYEVQEGLHRIVYQVDKERKRVRIVRIQMADQPR